MRILHVVSGDLWAGAEVQLYQLLRALRRYSHLTPSAVVLNEGELARRLAADGIETLVLDERKLSTTAILWKLLQHIRANRPDVVHTHRVKENILGSVCAFCLPGTQSLRTVHGADESDAQNGTLRQSVLRTVNRFSARWLQQCTIAVSTPLADSLRATLGDRRVVSIKNGVDPAYIQEQARGQTIALDARAAHVAFVGRMVPVKRVDRFLRVARSLTDRHGPTAFHFHLIGDGPLQGEMQELARSLRIDAQCSFHGFVPNPLPWLSQMSTLVLTSDHEGTPMVVLEALALGIPVVGPAVGGLIDALAGDGGHLVADQRIEDYAAAITRIGKPVASTASRGSMLPEEYDIATTARKYADIYERLVRRSGSARQERAY